MGRVGTDHSTVELILKASHIGKIKITAYHYLYHKKQEETTNRQVHNGI